MKDVKRFSFILTQCGNYMSGKNDGDYVLAADYDALAAELATERLRADAAVGDANAAERRAAELERWIRRIDRRNDDPKRFDPEMNLMIRQALAGQQQQGEQCMHDDGKCGIGGYCDECPAEAEQPVIYPEDDPDERAALAPAAAVMPERMTTIPEGKTISYAAGYEAALDAVANLNRNTVPLELLEQAIRCLDEKSNRYETHATKYATADQLRAILGAKP